MRNVAGKTTIDAGPHRAIARLPLLLFLWIGGVTLGCQRATPPALTPPKPAATPTNSLGNNSPSMLGKVASSTLADEPNVIQEASRPSEEGSGENGASVAAPPSASSPSATTRATPIARQKPFRLVWLGANGPVLLDLTLWIDGQPCDVPWQHVVQQVMELADENDDQRVTWDEMTLSRHIRYGQFGNERWTSEDQRRGMVQGLDINRDGLVAPEELPAFLSPTSASSQLLTISMRSENSDGQASSEPVVFHWLDTDQDGQLSLDEASRITERIRLWDTNGDGQVTTDERRQPTVTRPRSRSTLKKREPLILISSTTDWTDLLFRVEELYSSGAPIGPGDLLDRERLFRDTDEDQDETWIPEEVKRWTTLPADVTLVWRLSSSASVPQVIQAKVWEAGAGETETQATGESPPANDATQCVLELDGFERIQVEAAQLASTQVSSPVQQLWRQRAGSLETTIDEGAYSMLEPLLGFPFAAIDRDQDSKASWDELTRVWQQRAEAQNALFRLQVQVDDEPLSMLLDGNGDGTISERELGEAHARLQACYYGDATMAMLSNDQLPRWARWSLVTRSSTAPSRIGNGEMVAPVAEKMADHPAWFVAQDANRDGEVSRREYLGSPQAFSQIDRDGDGFVEPSEIRP